ncbi:putative F-box domain, galactose oxidase/kelch, beta-propeller, F-box associated interaction [Medicago truncatula]|uniref:F-box protein interaction domain protein n=1 Tax=Medicago truncatula TaxID=3880 RepID=G7IWP8_MEDTR|nr:F-box/kelch-repeat protein At3g06240 [Medicago truncatula]AES69461.1 F-box protein interaction domain protein [Medicago truncatula]RHN66254.1 putative F-box domain, galactose oxidase/kelch, beta-propeller, F-box associated interaction [Medicago truncatula]
MAQGSDAVSASHPFTVETTTTQRKRSTGTLTCPPPELPTLPFDLLPEILCRLPVKLLVQLRCLCEFFNSLISNPKFAKKHLQLSTKRHHLLVTSWNISRGEFVQHDFPIPLVFSTSTAVTQTQLYAPNILTNPRNFPTVMCCSEGILCGQLNLGSYFLYNPSIRKFKLLPPFENPCEHVPLYINFGYDHFIDNYKVIVVSTKNEVSVYTLGTDYWKRIEDIPYNIFGEGVFVSGTVNWLASDDSFILSLDVEKESYQQVLLPDTENDLWILGVLRNCLCILATSNLFLDVWIMNEYGNQESWTKLYSVPNMQDHGLEAYTVLYSSEDDQLLLEFNEMRSDKVKLVVYDSKTGTLNIPEFQNNYDQICQNFYIESLISP